MRRRALPGGGGVAPAVRPWGGRGGLGGRRRGEGVADLCERRPDAVVAAGRLDDVGCCAGRFAAGAVVAARFAEDALDADAVVAGRPEAAFAAGRFGAGRGPGRWP